MSIVSVALDTSMGFSLAIADEQGKLLLCEKLSAVGRESDRLLTPWVVDCLKKADSTLKEVVRWTVGTGPGSFAGLRCGIAMAKGAALVSGAMMRGVPSAYALASAAPAQLSNAGVLHDGRCGELLFERFLRKDGEWTLDAAPEPILPAALLTEKYACEAYVTAQEEVSAMVPEELKKKLSVVETISAEALLEAPESQYPWPSDWAGCEASTEPLYVRQAVFVKPATLRI